MSSFIRSSFIRPYSAGLCSSFVMTSYRVHSTKNYSQYTNDQLKKEYAKLEQMHEKIRMLMVDLGAKAGESDAAKKKLEGVKKEIQSCSDEMKKRNKNDSSYRNNTSSKKEGYGFSSKSYQRESDSSKTGMDWKFKKSTAFAFCCAGLVLDVIQQNLRSKGCPVDIDKIVDDPALMRHEFMPRLIPHWISSFGASLKIRYSEKQDALKALDWCIRADFSENRFSGLWNLYKDRFPYSRSDNCKLAYSAINHCRQDLALKIIPNATIVNLAEIVNISIKKILP